MSRIRTLSLPHRPKQGPSPSPFQRLATGYPGVHAVAVSPLQSIAARAETLILNPRSEPLDVRYKGVHANTVIITHTIDSIYSVYRTPLPPGISEFRVLRSYVLLV